ncbi:hotdog fold thioesterase [Psychrobacter sp. LV10R520-6]|uniref:hotdog fold thioesterase n=1 Tax=Psychrobacter sp. LV10R520-6 TaxID=1415574 RepID=UPI0024C6DC62|nr:hotdog fold thioesterase [Psychrobacter sp. LV10R520-6]SNT70609.1 acyl-CoA thioesterase [Psychrobacter sp. LV10R520-6]
MFNDNLKTKSSATDNPSDVGFSTRAPSFNRSLTLSRDSSEFIENNTSHKDQQSADNQALIIANKMLAEDYYSQHLGIDIVAARAGYSVCKMLVQRIHSNGHGNCHGGAIFSLADTTFAHICNAHNQIAVGQICTIAYWRPANIGDELYAYAYESGVHGRSGSYRIEITYGENGELVAEFQGFSRSLKGQSHL